MAKIWNTLLGMWRPLLIALLSIALVSFLLLWQLSSLLPGISTAELETYQLSQSLNAIIDEGIYLPYHAAIFAATSIFDSVFGLRLVNVAIGALTIGLFYFLSRKLLQENVSLIATGLFTTSSVFLALSRQATPLILLCSLLALVVVGYLVRFSEDQGPAWIIASIVIGLSLYVPGMIFFLLILGAWQFKACKRSFEALSAVSIIISSVTLSVVAAPLLISIFRSPDLWRDFLGLPSTLPHISQALEAAGNALMSIFIISPKQPDLWLGRQPLLDVFAGALFIYGSFSLIRHFALDRTKVFLTIFIVSILWIGLRNDVRYSVVLLPFLYLIAGKGFQTLISQWYEVFPRNPIARSVGFSLLIIGVVLSANLQLQRYFRAWPNNNETKTTFSNSLDIRTEKE